MVKRGIRLFFSVLFLCMLPVSVSFAESSGETERKEAWEGVTLQAEGFPMPEVLADGKRTTYTKGEEQNRILLTAEKGIYGIYIEFDRIPDKWQLTDAETEERYECGKEGFLHAYTDVVALTGGKIREAVLTFAPGTVIADIYVIQSETLPSYVQNWQEPYEEADLLLVSSHSDDEQLFFAGLLPLYAGEKQLRVQVAYVVQHFEANGIGEHVRGHEQLDGLWTVGVRNYPFVSDFPDLYAESKNRDTALAQAVKVFEGAGVTYEDVVTYLTECLRKCRPQVVVSHDFDGEYGHGTHVLCAKALQEAIAAAEDENAHPESAKAYGTWSVKKAYSHLYPENAIRMDYDTPLPHWNGKTAFEVSQEGFACHQSQHWTWFYQWIYGKEGAPVTKASQIRSYSPCDYGLYHTLVGADVIGGDFMENIVSYEEQQKKAAEEEALRLQEEENARQEALRKQEVAKQRNAEIMEMNEALRQGLQNASEAMRAERRRKTEIFLAGGGLTILLIGVSCYLIGKKSHK